MNLQFSSLRGLARLAVTCAGAFVMAACGSSGAAASAYAQSGPPLTVSTGPSAEPGNNLPAAGSSSVPVVTISATPSSVNSGGSSMITWSTSAASTCTASGGWTGAMSTKGAHITGALAHSTTYSLSCTGAGGTTRKSATVAINLSSCASTSGALTLNAKLTRSSGISPLLAFFDATGTTDTALTGKTTAFQDIAYSWNFGDAGASGTGTWKYGANAGRNTMNKATGGVAAHLYITNGSDTPYTATVTATDGTNTASCQLVLTAYDPSGPNGFPGSATTCVSSSGTPAAGKNGCPAGAAVLKTSSFVTALSNSQSDKRVLFNCGDTFTGNNALVTGQKFSVGAYGSCLGSTNGRPILSDNGSSGEISLGSGSSADFDGRFSDLDLEGNGNGGTAFRNASGTYPYQIVLNNIKSNGNTATFYNFNASQYGLFDVVMTGMGSVQGVFINNSENQCINGSHAYNCGGTPAYSNINYWALIGNSFNGAGAQNGSSGIETVRISACRLCVIENNTIENANKVGAVLKLHNGNPNSQGSWIGQYTELNEISDNLFTGTSGAQLVEIAPQNSVTDESLQKIVFERNLIVGVPSGSGKVLASVQNSTFRDNVFNTANTVGTDFSLQIARRGVEWNSTPGAPSNSSEPQYDEAYNNSCYSLSRANGCIGFDGVNFRSPGNDGWVKNNLYYNPAGGTTVSNTGTANTVSNNTATVTGNPDFINAGGSFDLLSDFMPTKNFLGGTDVPVHFDALGTAWPPTWDLGAVRP